MGHLEVGAVERDGTRWKIPDSTVCSKCSTVLLKADTGADVNLMNKQTFNQLFGKAKDLLQLTPIRMENYGNTTVKVKLYVSRNTYFLYTEMTTLMVQFANGVLKPFQPVFLTYINDNTCELI